MESPFLLRIVDEPEYGPRVVHNHYLRGTVDPLRLREVVYHATLEHQSAHVYMLDCHGSELCVASCYEDMLPQVFA